VFYSIYRKPAADIASQKKCCSDAHAIESIVILVRSYLSHLEWVTSSYSLFGLSNGRLRGWLPAHLSTIRKFRNPLITYYPIKSHKHVLIGYANVNQSQNEIGGWPSRNEGWYCFALTRFEPAILTQPSRTPPLTQFGRLNRHFVEKRRFCFVRCVWFHQVFFIYVKNTPYSVSAGHSEGSPRLLILAKDRGKDSEN